MNNKRQELYELSLSLRGWMEYARDAEPEGAAILSATGSVSLPPLPVRTRRPSTSLPSTSEKEALSVVTVESNTTTSELALSQNETSTQPAQTGPTPQPFLPVMMPMMAALLQNQASRSTVKTTTSVQPPVVTPTATAPTAPLRAASGKLEKAILPLVSAEERAARQELLQQVRQRALACQLCKLCQTRTQVVFGTGPAFAPVMFLGEGPGEQEDLSGEPFVGPAGQLLTKIIEATGFARSDVYIANVVKCRPPKNRDPEPDEIAACKPYLTEQIDLVAPKVIVTLGRFATMFLLGPHVSVSRSRGNVYHWRDIPVIPTFHPSYLLRKPEEKRLVWADMQIMRAQYDALRKQAP